MTIVPLVEPESANAYVLFCIPRLQEISMKNFPMDSFVPRIFLQKLWFLEPGTIGSKVNWIGLGQVVGDIQLPTRLSHGYLVQKYLGIGP